MVRKPTQRVNRVPASLATSLMNSSRASAKMSSIGVHKRHGSKVAKKSQLKELKMNLQDIYHNHQLTTTTSSKLHASRSLTRYTQQQQL